MLKFLLCFTIATTVYGDEIRRPYLDDQQLQLAKETLERPRLRAVESQAEIQPDLAFQGWWKMVLRGNEFGFGFGAQTDDIDSYVYIDLSQYDPANNKYVKISTICGTPTQPREITPLDVRNGAITMNDYYVPESTALVNVLDLNGPAFNPINGQSFWSLKLQADKKTICVSSDSQPQWEGYQATSNLLTKIESPPPILPYDNTAPVSDPVYMAKYIFNATELNHNQPLLKI
jgi:hypothetical protein